MPALPTVKVTLRVPPGEGLAGLTVREATVRSGLGLVPPPSDEAAAYTSSSPIETKAALPPGAPSIRMPSPWIGLNWSVYVWKPTPLLPAYAGVVARFPTPIHCPLCRTCTVSVLNHPPSPKCIPSWNTTRVNVCGLPNVYPTQSSAAAFAPSQLSYCRRGSHVPAAGRSPSRITARLPPLPVGVGTRAMIDCACAVTEASVVAAEVVLPEVASAT